MSRLRRATGRLLAMFAGRSLDKELEDELAAHIDLAVDEYIERGMTPEQARRRAMLEFGGMQQAREHHREARGFMNLDILLQDLKYTLRTLRRDPGFTTVAVLILALAIGANIAVFSVVNTLMLRPLPFPNAQQLVWIAPPPTKCGLSCATYSSDAFDEFRAQTRSYQDVTGYFAFGSPDNLRLTGRSQPVAATSIDIINNFFQVLGVEPAMGRLFTPDDTRNGAPPVIVMTNAWWKRQFAADPNIIGKTLDLNGQQTTVVGVLPASFDFGAVFAPGTKTDAFTPLNLDVARNWGNIVTFLGRLKPGVSLNQAKTEANTVSGDLYQSVTHPETKGNYKGSIVPVPLKDYVSGKLRRSLAVLWCAVGAILLIACVNLSNLLLARASARSKEFAMRGALGASRGRIVRQLLTESLVLSGAGAAFGLLLALSLVRWLAHQGAIALPLLGTLNIDGAALGWTVLIVISAAVLFGFVPGLRMAGGDLQESLKDTGAGSGHSRKHERIRSILVVSEVALACMLLVGAGLMLRSFLKVLDVDLGFQPERAAAVKFEFDDSVPPGSPDSASAQKRTVIFQQVLSRISAIPGIEAAGIVDYLPLGQNREWDVPFPKGVKPPEAFESGPLVYVATPGYLRAMGTRLRGRDFAWSDGPKSQQVVMINEAYAHFLASFAHWPNGDAVGQIITSDPKNDPKNDLRVIGVVDDVHEENVDGDTGWQIYYPATRDAPAGAELVIRTTLPPATLATSVLRTLRDLNPKQPVAEFRPIQNLVDHATSPRRFFMLLVAAFATLGLLLAALGIYGVISYSVTRQTQEIGIRMALGASAGMVERQVLVSTLRLALIGVFLGAAASLLTARLISSLLFATSPWDAATYIAMALALLAVATLSGYLPARRAAHISPMVALRAT
jgi:predicted permease